MTEKSAKRQAKRPRDVNQRAKLIVDIVTGESDEPKKPAEKDPAAVELGRRGGQARAKNLSAKERSAQAKKAVTRRWSRSAAE
jgi:hypothetical protein